MKVYIRFPFKPHYMKKICLFIIALLFIELARSQNIAVEANVGIGTTSPSAKLEIIGGLKVSDSVNIGGQVRIVSGSPAMGKVLTCDSNGVASWTWPAAPAKHFIGEDYGVVLYFMYMITVSTV